jgi:hypothetical protein
MSINDIAVLVSTGLGSFAQCHGIALCVSCIITVFYLV